MELLQKIIECSEEHVDSIIEVNINETNKKAKQVKKLGFLGWGKTNNIFKGFIPLNTRIKYSNLNMEDYGMQTTDFIYEFAHFIRKYNINNKTSLIHNLEYFINSYFGTYVKIKREIIFNDNAWKNTTSDAEYFKALENNKIGDLKGKNAAQCTERSALVQQILSIFGIESYYCIGCVDLKNKQEPHCFNVVKRKKDYALLDYSLPVTSYNLDGSVKNYYPFIGLLTNEEFSDFINNGTIKAFDDYCMNGTVKEKTNEKRLYVIGSYEITKENENGNSR